MKHRFGAKSIISNHYLYNSLNRFFYSLRPTYDGPTSWLWFVGSARIGMFLVLVAGVYLIAPPVDFNRFLLLIYLAAFVSSVWYLVVLLRERTVSPVLTWTQMLVDFGVVSATISLTQGQESFFTFLLVIVILEAGILLGLTQGFVFASLSSGFMLTWFVHAAPLTTDPITHWYNFLIQCIAFFFTAFISGYWNQRVSRMKQFQHEILDNMNSGFLITDTRGLVIVINKAACQILDLVEGNITGLHVESIMRQESGAECPITTALRLHKDFSSYEFYTLTGRNEVKLLGLTTNRLKDNNGRQTGLIVAFTDLTEMARMRRELQQQDRMAVIGELTAGLAHEIRNPVASIRSAMEEINRSMDTPQLVERLAKIAVRESDHLNEIVSGFLDFARDPSRRHKVLEVGAILSEVAEQLSIKYEDYENASITLQWDEVPAPVMGDATQLRQVFINLGQNAIEAMNYEGNLEIILNRNAPHGPLDIRFNDEGPGIAPDKVARIFEPFYTEKERGVGMGLSICQRMITAHDGTIQVASRPVKGTSFLVRLPVYHPQDALQDKPQGEPQGEPQS